MENVKNRNMKKILKYGYYMISIILISIYTYLMCFKVNFYPYDESWNFQNMYKIFEGMTIYKDANVIITPLFFIVGQLLFKILTPTIMTFRIYNLILCLILYSLIFVILNKQIKSKLRSFLYLVIFLNFSIGTVTGGANYNVLALIFVCAGILTFFYKRQSRYYHYYQGLIVFLCFFTKHNIGALYGIGLLVYEIIFSKNDYIKNNIKKFIAFIIPVFIYIIYLVINNNLYNFINYVFLGMGSFINNIAVEWSSLLLLICPMTLLLYIFTRKINKKYDFTEMNFISIISIFLLFVAFPISNEYHNCLGLIATMILLVSIIDIFVISEIISEKYQWSIKAITLVLLSILLLQSISFVYAEGEKYYFIDSEVYKNIPLDNDSYNRINELNEYINKQEYNNKKVVILSYDTSLINIYIANFNGIKDLIFVGNLGKNGTNEIIEEIKNSKNTLYLVKKDKDDYFLQEITEIIEFVKDNLEKQEEIVDYEVYSSIN